MFTHLGAFPGVQLLRPYVKLTADIIARVHAFFTLICLRSIHVSFSCADPPHVHLHPAQHHSELQPSQDLAFTTTSVSTPGSCPNPCHCCDSESIRITITRVFLLMIAAYMTHCTLKIQQFFGHTNTIVTPHLP